MATWNLNNAVRERERRIVCICAIMSERFLTLAPFR